MSKLMLDKIDAKFDINYKKGLYNFNDISTIENLPQRVVKSLKEVKPNNLFIINGKIIILFFNKKANKEEVFKKCWNFGEVPIVIIETETDFEIYNGFDYILKSKDIFELEPIKQNGLNYLSLISGTYFKDNKLKQKNKRVDKVLLENIKYTREQILNNLNSLYTNKLKDNRNIVNSLIGRIIFIRYLVDREVILNFENINKPLTNEDLKEILNSKKRTYELFNYLKSDDGFNGDWFPVSDEEITTVKVEHLTLLKEFISGTQMKNGQRTLFDIYDFSIIPVEFISNIYESFIGEEKQKEDGAYYTPTFLVDYILKYTVDDYFKNNPKEYNCKILDPACGSGIFLVETLRKLVAQYEKIHKNPISAKKLKQLVLDNIYAIDYNSDALAISVFSLYITMLDYQNPKEIEKFKFPYLLKGKKNKLPNFFEADFFDTEAEYSKILKDKKLDFIIGNPPYGKGTIKKDSFSDTYIKLNKIEVGNRDIVQAFMIRVKDLVDNNTKISFIVTSKVLYNLQTKDFRKKHFFNNFKINHILELSSVRHDIFENATVPVSILLYEYSTKEEVLKNVINYISMKPSPYFKKLKILLLSKSDFKKINQSKLIDKDYLWKILVYGSYLDFNFITRLKTIKTLDEYIENKKDKEQGITPKGKNKNSTLEYIGMPYIQTKQFKPFYIEESNLTWEKEFAHRSKSIDFFKAPSLLISRGISSELDLKIGILHKNSIFTNSITSVKSNDTDTLYGIMGILYSSFFKYYIMNTGSSIGIEREEIYNYEKFSLPHINNQEIVQSTKSIEEYSKNTFTQHDKEFYDLKEKLNENVLEAFELNEQEYSLVDYTNSIVIPWIMQKKYNVAFAKYAYKDKTIEKYVNIFIKHYSSIYEQNNLYFKAEILWDDYAIGIYFKILKDKPNESITWKKEKKIQNFLKLSSEETLEQLFIQKDVKGFESDGFYVVKPNEYKNWHKAIGYLDFYEFQDAILKAGK